METIQLQTHKKQNRNLTLMNPQTPPITEINKVALKKLAFYLDNINLDNNDLERVVLTNTFFNYEDVVNNINSLLNTTVRSLQNDNDDLCVYEVANVLGMVIKLVNQLPIEFVDNLIFKSTHNKDGFTNIDSL